MKQQERPRIHFTPPFGWMNDPNGLIYNNGYYHLFYQYYPQGVQWGPTHWGHAVSENLVKWEHLPIAFSPDDTGMCFSGSTMSDYENKSGLFSEKNKLNLLAYYTLAGEHNNPNDYFYQAQNLQFSDDGGFSWKKYAQNPIMEDPSEFHFRDPCVFWHEESAVWVMVITLGQKVGIYNSLNGIDWERVSEFGEGHGRHDDMAWECPDLFALPCPNTGEVLWVLCVAMQQEAYTTGSGTQYFLGKFDGKDFVNINSESVELWLDYGRDYYRMQTFSEMSDCDGRRIGLAWMSCWSYANFLPTNNWRSTMSFPREYTLGYNEIEGYFISQMFIREVDSCFSEAEPLSELIATREFRLDYSRPLRFKFQISFSDNSIFKIWCNESSELIFHVVDNRLILYSIRRGTIGEQDFDKNYPHNYYLCLSEYQDTDIELLLDNGSSELLINQGKYSLTNLSYQFSDKPNTVSIMATNNLYIREATMSKYFL